jgi:hypothetical protein
VCRERKEEVQMEGGPSIFIDIALIPSAFRLPLYCVERTFPSWLYKPIYNGTQHLFSAMERSKVPFVPRIVVLIGGLVIAPSNSCLFPTPLLINSSKPPSPYTAMAPCTHSIIYKYPAAQPITVCHHLPPSTTTRNQQPEDLGAGTTGN